MANPAPSHSDEPDGSANGAQSAQSSQSSQSSRRGRTRSTRSAAKPPVVAPWPHPSGAVMPQIPAGLVPQHVAIVMDGNGRWANQRGLPRIEGHKAGEPALLDVMAGAIEMGIKYVSVYAFSTENWKRSPEEVRFLMGFNKDVLRRQRDQLDAWGVRVRWAGRKPRLWGSVIKELEVAQERTLDNDTITLTMCVNYGGRAEIADAVTALAEEVAAGKLNPRSISEKTIQRHMYAPDVPDVDLFLRSSGEQRLSNFMLWQSAYAEFVFMDQLWPDVDRRTLWKRRGRIRPAGPALRRRRRRCPLTVRRAGFPGSVASRFGDAGRSRKTGIHAPLSCLFPCLLLLDGCGACSQDRLHPDPGRAHRWRRRAAGAPDPSRCDVADAGAGARPFRPPSGWRRGSTRKVWA